MKRKREIFLLLLVVFCLGIILSILRYPGSDESYYLRETTLISNCFKNFQWIGNELVGVHGFFFKIPVALLFLITGPSVFIATIVNISFGVIIIYLCYLIFLKITNSWEWALAGSFLVFSGVNFLRVLPSFLRDCPAMLSILLFIYFILKRKSNLWIALSLLLVLDAKEGVFFMILPGFLIWLVIEEFSKHPGQNSLNSMKNLFKKGMTVFSPSLLYIFLMVMTGIIPLNPILTSYLGLNQGGLPGIVGYQVENAKSQYENEIIEENLERREEKKEEDRPSKGIFNSIGEVFRLYFRKILYFRTFSLSSMPRFIILPALLFSFVLFNKWRKRKETGTLILPLIFWSGLLVYILRSSHGRYLLPITPVIVLFFILFLKDGLEKIRFSRNVFIATIIFIGLGLFFENVYIVHKIILYLFILSGFFLILYSQAKQRSSLLKMKWSYILMIGFFTFCTQMAFSYLQPGQIGRFLTWGYCGDMKKIAESFEEREPIWINVDSSLFKFFVEEDKKLSFYPNNNIWKLKPWFPKYKKLNNNRKQYVFSFPSEQESFFEKLNEKGIKKVAVVVSSSKNQKFKYRKQNWLDIFREFAFLKPLDPVKMKNKVLHVFEVTNLGFD